MAYNDGRGETGSSSGKSRVKDSQLEDHNQQPAAINNPNESREEEEEEEEREHQEQEAEPTLEETNRESQEEEEDAKRDAAAGEENEEINEGAETQLPHGEMIKKRKTDHEEEASSSGCGTLVGGDAPGAQTGETAMTMMGRPGSEVGGGVSDSAAAEQRVLSLECKYCYWSFSNPQALGEHVNAYHRKPSAGAAAEKPKSGGGDGGDKEAAWGVECEYCHRTFKSWRGLMVHERLHARDRDPKLLQRQKEVIEMGKSLSASAAAADKPKTTGGGDGGDKDAAGGGVKCHEKVHAGDDEWLRRQRDFLIMRWTSARAASTAAARSDDVAAAADRPDEEDDPQGPPRPAGGGGGDGGSDNEGDDEEQRRWFVEHMVGKRWF